MIFLAIMWGGVTLGLSLREWKRANAFWAGMWFFQAAMMLIAIARHNP